MANSNKAFFKVVAQSFRFEKQIKQATPTSSSTGSPQFSPTITKNTKPINNGDTSTSSRVSFLTILATHLINPPLHPAVDPKVVLVGNFAPVNETPPTECSVVEGELPPSLNGAYVRNGPNPQHEPLGPHHLFEGDGMLHSIRIREGRATFCSRYVKTYKYKLECDAGVPVIPNIFSGFYGLADLGRCFIALLRSVTGQIILTEGFGVANTSLAFFHNTLFAMVETDLPYAIRLTREGDIETIGRYDFARTAPPNLTAHPKIDTETDEIFAFQCFPVFPFLTFFCFDADGRKQQDVPMLSIHHPTGIHDFAITRQYAVFPDTQLEMAPMNLVMCKGMPVRFRLEKVTRIGIIPRYATSDLEMRWFSIPHFNAFHIINAWEDDQDGIIIVAPNALNTENFFTSIEKVHFSLEKVRIDMKTGKTTRTILSKRNLELGSIHPTYIGKKNKYVYMAIGEHVPKMSGVVKIDLELGCEVASRSYERDCFGGEVVFVGRNCGEDLEYDEDDGFVVTYMHNEISNESRFVVMDAKSPTLDVLAAVKLPGRVPYGFHGLFLCEKDLQEMNQVGESK
ncbi:probable carotenoid cleavage dioxygenase 4, chloroplastic [Actinidia eriantha]|uniref:probable carotenoid cleavage dioxygenase 4, chloroplastic n=1 Tax=Actinidia eriantha TaxID=165200 RepID=UPI00258D67E0|nr:probable carotenoid cleavage dioxygenase 4, chloroplastic [Actinidia eriantha]